MSYIDLELFSDEQLLSDNIEKTFHKYGVNITLKNCKKIEKGYYKYDIKLKSGTTYNLLIERAKEVQLVLKLQTFHIFTENDLRIRIIVSKKKAIDNSLKKILTSSEFQESQMAIPLAIGYDIKRQMFIADLQKLVHILLGGSTNSGKTIALLNLIISIIVNYSPNNMNFLLFDIGANGMKIFKDIPHLCYPIVKDEETGIRAILALINEMEKRINLSPQEWRALPSIVCVIDEYVSFVSNIRDKEMSKMLTASISNLLRRGRHAKIHVILATQDPTTKATNIDLGNITTRMAFKCGSFHNSVAILGTSGAEKLSGNGAMLFKSPAHLEPIHLQGAFMSEPEMANLTSRIINHWASSEYDNKYVMNIPSETADETDFITTDKGTSQCKELIEIIIWALSRESISTRQIQYQFRMGNRASKIADKLYEFGIIADKFANLPREVLPKSIGDISDKVIDFLSANDVSMDDIISAIENRNTELS